MQDLTQSEAQDILKASRLGVLSLAHDGRTYGIPLFYGYDGDVYFHCHPGMKDEYLDSTEEACLVVIHMETQDIWESVQVFGKVEKLSLNTDIEAAKAALYQVPFPPAGGHFPSGSPKRSDQDVYYARLKPTRYAGKASGSEE